ncbi:MAG: hypothetical protein NVSMB2_27970 [Chloroflexota bacterium]
MSAFRFLRVTEDNRIVTVRPTHTVAPGPDTTLLALELVEMCADLDARLQPLCAVVFSSDAEGYFLTPSRSIEDTDGVDAAWAQATRAVGRLQQPTLAVLTGDGVGAAWELALACDLRLASPGVKVGTPDVARGRLPRAGGTQRLARLVGIPTALELLLLSRVLTAPEALERGMLHRVGDVDAILQEISSSLRSSAPIAANFAKEAVHASAELSLDAGMRFEADLAALLLTTDDRAEGLSAFLARRRAQFEGR